MDPKSFKVIIVGGSISGLSLALMLERNGIDFLVLEGYQDIAPQVGASIGVLSNGLRILDQLDCCQAVIDAAEHPAEEVRFHNSQGVLLMSLKGYKECITERHGYPTVFLDRCMLIEILYNKIQDKSKVLTSQRVQSIESSDSQVTVSTSTGQAFIGNIVVGADGIHSTVRREMRKEARRIDPEWFDPSEESAVPATYACIFGISEGGKGVEKGTMTSVLNEHFSYVIGSGPGKRTYWFLVRNMGKTYYGADIPRFSKEEEEDLAKEHWDDQLTPSLRFSDLYTSKIASVYTTLPEYVFKKWHFQRIVTIGDASHKFQPLTGQGGNNALETAAALANQLVSALRAFKANPLSTAEISKIFNAVQKQRMERVSWLIESSHARQRFECMETRFLKFFATWVSPYIPTYMIYNQLLPTYAGATSLKILPMPVRSRDVAYYDERFRVPRSRGIVGVFLYAAFFFLAWAGNRQLWTAVTVNGTWGLVREAVQSHSVWLSSGVEVPLRQSFTGVGSIDAIFKSLVTVFLPVVANVSRPEQILQGFYFLASILPIMAVWAVEGYRPRNKWTLLASPSIWGVLFQLRGIGLIAPLYFSISLFHSSSIEYFTPSSRTIPESTAWVLLPALFIGFIMPTIMMFFPLPDTLSAQQIFIALWQPSPIYVVILIEVLSCTVRRNGKTAQVKSKIHAESTNRDIPYLQIAYLTSGSISACVHLTLAIKWIFFSTTDSISQAFIPWDSFAEVSHLADGIFIFFQNEFLLLATAAMLWCWASIWDLYRVGISNVSWRSGFASLLLGCIVIGPGATVAAVWYWREEVLSRTTFGQHPSVPI